MKQKEPRYWLRLITFASGILLFGILGSIIYLSAQGAHNYAHPARFQRQPGENPTAYGVDYQDITLKAEDGIELAAWYTEPQNDALILLAHGYGAARPPTVYAMLARNGYGVLTWDARAHGESGGDLCTWGYYEQLDVAAALDFARSQPGVEHIGALGHSMGAATLILAAADQPAIEALVADSAFAAIEDLIPVVSPNPILKPFLVYFTERETGLKLDHVRPVDFISKISPRPVFIIHGQLDLTVPFGSATRLGAAALEPRDAWFEPGIGHVETFLAYPEMYESRVIGFFDYYLLGK
jgi:fermentation-respiration switch protein FrsA (DUF1100 family)